MAERPRYVVDFHTHAFPDRVVDRAMAALSETYGARPVATPTLSGLLAYMDASGVDLSVVMPVATRPDQVPSINDWAAASCSDRILCFGSLHPDLPNPAPEVARMVGMGLKGAKLHPHFQQFHPDDPRVFPLYEAMQGKLIALFHSGQEIIDIPYVHARPARLARVHQTFPELTIVVAHMGGFRMWEEAREGLIGSEVYLETSFCPERDLPDPEFLGLIQAHGTARTLFGSDFPWGEAATDIARLCQLGLTQEEVETVAWQNAEALLRLGLE
jgi:predicted TIM-barrel fold metal-dependent hydrolase